MEELFKSIKKKDLEAVQRLIEENDTNTFKWHPRQNKSTYHQICEYFNKPLFEWFLKKSFQLGRHYIMLCVTVKASAKFKVKRLT